jgi:amphi-Trp domain-containing protein
MEPKSSIIREADTYQLICMAKLLGETGKTSMKFSSEKGFDEFKQKFSLSKSEAAAFLRDLAQEIEEGDEVEVSHHSVSISIDPESPIKIEVELEEDELEIEIKLKARS